MLGFKLTNKQPSYILKYVDVYLLRMILSIVLVCKPGFYNRTSNCTDRCGHCRDNTACDSESGRCPGGCKPHFKDPVCQGTFKHTYNLDVDVKSIYFHLM